MCEVDARFKCLKEKGPKSMSYMTWSSKTQILIS